MQVVVNSFWSSAFLITFVTSIWGSVCGVRQVREIVLRATGAPAAELDKWFDPVEDWGPLLGCALCGTSIAFEAEGRRRLLALYVASRASLSVWQAYSLPVGENGDVLLLSGSVALLAFCAKKKRVLVSSEALKMLALAGLN